MIDQMNFSPANGLRDKATYPRVPGDEDAAREQVQGRLDEIKNYINNTLLPGVDAHKADYVRQPGYGTTTGAANTYALTLDPAPTAYVAGMGVVVKINAANTGASTININGLGAKTILDSKGNALVSGKLKLNIVYTLRYDGSNFILQGEGGEIPKLSNVLRNGSFENDAVGWATGGSVTTETSGAIYHGSKCRRTVSNAGNISYDYVDIPFQNGDKIYVTSMFYPEAYTSGSKSGLSIYQYGNWNNLAGYAVDTAQLMTWQRLSGIVTAANGGVRVVVGRGSVGVENTRYDALMVINLTEAFGAGNEPSVTEMDAMVAKFGGWWDILYPPFTPGENLIASSANSVAINNTDTIYAKKKETKVNYNGTFRVKFDASYSQDFGTLFARLHKNGNPIGTERTIPVGTTTYTEDIALNEGDLIQVYAKVGTSNNGTRNISNFKVSVAEPLLATVII